MQTDTTQQQVKEQPNGLNAQVMLTIERAPKIKEVQAAAAEYLKQFDGLVITDADTYKSAKAFFTEVRSKRLALQKEFGEATTGLKALVKSYDGAAGKVLEQYKATEGAIRAEVQRVDDEAQAEKERVEREKAQKFIERTDALFAAGFTFNGYAYVVGAVAVDTTNVHEMGDEDFARTCERGAAEAARIKAMMEAMAQVEVEEAQDEPPPIAVQVFDLVEPAPPPAREFDDFLAPPKETDKEIAERVFRNSGINSAFTGKPAAENYNYTPPGFTAGFDACKKQVLDLLAGTEKFTRAALVERIEQMRAGGGGTQ